MPEKRSARPALLAMLCATLSACGQPEPLRTAPDTLCLNDRRISIEPAPVKGMDDPGNAFDSEATVNEVLAHNAVLERLCPRKP